MASYYVNRNAQANRDLEVHTTGCPYFPDAGNGIYLGEFANCRDAVEVARSHYTQVNGCYYCSP